MQYYKYVNGKYVEMTDEEIAEVRVEHERDYFFKNSYDIVKKDDLLDLILASYNVVKPDGSSVSAMEITDTTIDLPLKVGYKWAIMLDEEHKRFTYVLTEDPDALGTSDNPIYYYDGCPLIDNAFYIKDGVQVVYMSGEFVEM